MQWEAIQWVSGTSTLIAFVTLTIAWVYKHQLQADLETIKSAPDEKRADLIITKHLGINIDTANLTREQKLQLAHRQLDINLAKYHGKIHFLIVLSILGAAVLALSIWQSHNSELAAEKARNEEKSKQIKDISHAREQLQHALDLFKTGTSQFAGELRGFANTSSVSRANSAVRRLSDNLLEMINQFEKKTQIEPLTPAESLEVNLAKATIANAHQRYNEALAYVTNQDLARETDAFSTQNRRLMRALQVRADSYLGLRNWKQAFELYSKMAKIDPLNSYAVVQSANCLLRLTFNADAIDQLQKAISIIRLIKTTNKNRQDKSQELAATLTNLSVALRFDRRPKKSRVSVEEAIPIMEHLTNIEDRRDLLGELAMAHNNHGTVLRDLGLYKESYIAFGKSIAIYEVEIEGKGEIELENTLAMALTNRGLAYLLAKESLAEAKADFDRAISIRTRLVGKDGKKECEPDLACSLSYRGALFGEIGSGDNAKLAESDCERAIAIYDRWVNVLGHAELSADFALALTSQANVLDRLQKPDKTFSIVTRGVAIYSDLVEKQKRAELESDFAYSLTSRGIITFHLARLEKDFSEKRINPVMEDFKKAVGLYEKLILKEPRDDLKADLASCFGNRAPVFGTINDLSHCKEDCDRAVELQTELVERKGRKDISDSLAKSLLTRGLVWLHRDDKLKAISDFNLAARYASDPNLKKRISAALQSAQ